MKLIYLFALLLTGAVAHAQYAPFSPTRPIEKDGMLPRIKTEDAAYFRLTEPAALAKKISSAPWEDASSPGTELHLQLLAPDGTPHTFRIHRYRMIEDELQAAFPEFAVASGWDIDAPYRSIALTWTSSGLRASILGGQEGRWYFEPVFRGDRVNYQSFYPGNVREAGGRYSCDFHVEDDLLKDILKTAEELKRVGDCQLRRYDLALACTAHYYNQIAGISYSNGTPPTPTAANESDVVAEMMTAINRVNQIFRRDLAIQLDIINLPTPGGNVQLIYGGDTLADPYSNFNGAAMLNQNQQTVDMVIGSANYDIGHVFSTGGGGIADLGSPCDDSRKARGVTGLPNPVGDPFYVDFVAHEIGHQFGGTHTFNSTEGACAARTAITAYEPGGGTTIQAYAGICGPTANIQLNSDPYYHAASIQQIAAYMELGGGASCADISSTSNTQPTVTPVEGVSFVIPTNTPFVLDAVGTDGDGDALTYCWEQFDAGLSPTPGVPTGFETDGPLFRSFPPTPDSERYFPGLDKVLNGTGSQWEVLPKVARDLTFVVTVRDGNGASPGEYGCTVQEQVNVQVVNTPEQFAVITPNGGEVWVAGTTQTVSWNVAGTDQNPINCDMVELVLSTDGGQTFDQSLGVFPNTTGSVFVAAPILTATDARIMVRCDGNIFFTVGDDNFSIEQRDFSLTGVITELDNCSKEDPLTGYEFTASALQGYTGTVTFQAVDLPSGVTATFSPASVTFTSGGSTTETVLVSLSNADALATANYTFDVLGTDGMGGTKELAFLLESTGDFGLTQPAEGAVIPDDPDGISRVPVSWEAVPGATSYEIVLGSSTLAASGTSSTIIFGDQPDGVMVSFFIRALPGGEITCTRTVTLGEVAPPTNSLSQTGSPITACAGSDVEESFVIRFIDNDLTGPADLSITDSPAGLTVAPSSVTLNDGETVELTLSGEENLPPGDYTITATADDGTNQETIDLILRIVADEIDVLSPADESRVPFNPNVTGCDGFDGGFLVTFEVDEYDGPETASDYTVTINRGNANLGSFGIMPNTPVQVALCANEGDVFSYLIQATLGNGSTAQSCNRTFTVTDNPLPVEWLNFTARAQGKSAHLAWSVLQDAAHADFTVERSSATEAGWRDVATVSRRGPDGLADYTYIDAALPSGATFQYRIRQNDLDGSVSHSVIRAVTLGESGTLSVYPNPVTEVLTARLNGIAVNANTEHDYRLVSSLGRVVRTGKITGDSVEIPMQGLPTAIYQLIVEDGNGPQRVARVVKR